MSGRWSVYWDDEGEQEIIPDAWDIVSIPVHVTRGFRNVGDSRGYLMAILGGIDAGKVSWAEKILARARETGLAVDDVGNLVVD